MATLQSRNIPRSGSTALAAGALVQAILGGEFVLAGLNKLADPQYVAHFRDFVSGSAGLIGGPLASLVRLVVLPNVTLMAQLARFTELGAGLVLVLVAFEVAWRRFHGRLGTRHGYEPAVALGVANNERLTALAGMHLFILLAAMAVTVLFVQQLLPEH